MDEIQRPVQDSRHTGTQGDADPAPDNRQDAASASPHAMQCIRNIFTRLGDIVASVAIERERFVVLEIRESEELPAPGKIVLAPSGACAYCLKRSGVEQGGQGERGMIFFPLGSQIEAFDAYRWRAKEEA